MADTGPSALSDELSNFEEASSTLSSEQLSQMISEETLVGDIVKMDYASCEVLVHDYRRKVVGGLPLGCFLLASRIAPGSKDDPLHEDTNLVLLRIVGQSKLPNSFETDLGRFQAGQRVADKPEHWDADSKTDQFTLNILRYAGLSCRVLGTFRMEEKSGKWEPKFGADVSNFYSGRGLKVYKPMGTALSNIVNFTKSKLDDSHPLAGMSVEVGRVRYSSSERLVDETGENVRVNIDPSDLVARRTALFGMSRTGKSNTTKVIASSVFRMREKSESKGRVGQLIFDVNGEYANENTQDGTTANAACLKNVAQGTKNAKADDVVTYGLTEHPLDPDRKLVKVNFFGEEPNWFDYESVCTALDSLIIGKSVINELIAGDDAKYMRNFRETNLEVPLNFDGSASTRYRRAILVYRAVLAEAGFETPRNLANANTKNLFSKDFLTALEEAGKADQKLKSAHIILSTERPTWSQVFSALKALPQFLKTKEYEKFNSSYMKNPKRDGRSWDDDTFTGMLSILPHQNGPKAIRPAQAQHGANSAGDYAKSIIEDLTSGKLVIFDQSMGDPELNKSIAERIMWQIFNQQKSAFVSPQKDSAGNLVPPPDMLVYAEEAHNLLPAGATSDTSNIWSRAAKEGSKYRIGLVYATQEPSSIQSNILKNTDNWFVAHLNNADEVRELKKYYDFDDFVASILQVPDPGFLRMRTLSNPYIVPVQVKKFEVSL